MAKLSPPDRGQPLDVSYIREIVDAVNNLSNELSPTVANSTSIDTVLNGKHTMKTSNARIVAGYKDVSYDSNTTPGYEVPFEYEYEDFKFAPIVTATPIISTSTLASKDISIVLTSITTKKVSGLVRFNSTGVANVGINLLIVGKPWSAA